MKPYMTEIAHMGLEAAKESDKVVLSWACPYTCMWTFLREQLMDAGAKNCHLVVLSCDLVPHMTSLFKRFQIQAKQADVDVGELIEIAWKIPGLTDLDSFLSLAIEHKDEIQWGFQEPNDSEKPYDVVNVTSRDVSVLDSLGAAFGIQENGRAHLPYKEIVARLQEVDAERDRIWTETITNSGNLSPAEQELIEKEPEKHATRRSSLLQA